MNEAAISVCTWLHPYANQNSFFLKPNRTHKVDVSTHLTRHRQYYSYQPKSSTALVIIQTL